MIQPLADEDRALIDVPIPELRVTARGRTTLAHGEFGPDLAEPGFDPELALNLLFAVACWEDNYPAAGPSS